MKKHILLLFLGIFLLPLTYAQSIDNIVATLVNKDLGQSPDQTFLTQLKTISFKIPVFQEFNLRTESDQNNFARQEFALRTMFNGFGMSKVYLREKQLLEKSINLSTKKRTQSKLFNIYKDVIDLYFLQAEDSLLRQRILINEKQLSQQIKILASGTEVDAKDILKLEKERYYTDKRIGKITIEKQYLLKLLETSSIDFSSWKEIELLESRINALNPESLNLAAFEKIDIDKNKADIEYQLDRKNDLRVLDYFQIRYSKRDNLLFEDEFSLGAGLRIPYQGTHKRKHNDYQIKNWEADFKKQLTTIDVTNSINSKKGEFQQLISEIRYFQQTPDKVFRSLNESHFQNKREIEIFKEDLILSIQESNVDRLHKAYRLYLDIYHEAELLDASKFLTK